MSDTSPTRAGSGASAPVAAWTAAIAVSLLALLTPALLNGFPLVFADSGGYLERVFRRDLDIGRSALYGLFLAAGIPLNFWPNVVAQAALTLWVLALSLRTFGLGGRPLMLLACVAGLCALTGLPWFVGQLMPDIFLPLSVLSLHLLAFRSAALSRPERAGLVAVIAIGIAFHMTVLAVVAALVLAGTAYRLVASRYAVPSPAGAAPLLGLSAGIALALLSNLAIAGQFAFTPGGSSYLFGRVVQDGIVGRYLADRCPEESLRLCPYRNALPSTTDGWLWDPESPLHKLGWWRGYKDEAERIIGETLRLYPGQHAATAVRAAADQFVRLRTGEGIHSRDNWFTDGVLAQLAPGAVAAFRASRQQTDRFAFDGINFVQVPLALLAVAGLAACLFVRRRVSTDAKLLAGTVLLALIANAAVCGIFSNPNDRYQNRVAWVAPFALWLAVSHPRSGRPP